MTQNRKIILRNLCVLGFIIVLLSAIVKSTSNELFFIVQDDYTFNLDDSSSIQESSTIDIPDSSDNVYGYHYPGTFITLCNISTPAILTPQYRYAYNLYYNGTWRWWFESDHSIQLRVYNSSSDYEKNQNYVTIFTGMTGSGTYDYNGSKRVAFYNPSATEVAMTYSYFTLPYWNASTYHDSFNRTDILNWTYPFNTTMMGDILNPTYRSQIYQLTFYDRAYISWDIEANSARFSPGYFTIYNSSKSVVYQKNFSFWEQGSYFNQNLQTCYIAINCTPNDTLYYNITLLQKDGDYQNISNAGKVDANGFFTEKLTPVDEYDLIYLGNLSASELMLIKVNANDSKTKFALLNENEARWAMNNVMKGIYIPQAGSLHNIGSYTFRYRNDQTYYCMIYNANHSNGTYSINFTTKYGASYAMINNLNTFLVENSHFIKAFLPSFTLSAVVSTVGVQLLTKIIVKELKKRKNIGHKPIEVPKTDLGKAMKICEVASDDKIIYENWSDAYKILDIPAPKFKVENK